MDRCMLAACVRRFYSYNSKADQPLALLLNTATVLQWHVYSPTQHAYVTLHFQKHGLLYPNGPASTAFCQQQLACSGFCSICTTKTPADGCSGCVAQKRGAPPAEHSWCNETERLHYQGGSGAKILTHLKNGKFLPATGNTCWRCCWALINYSAVLRNHHQPK